MRHSGKTTIRCEKLCETHPIKALEDAKADGLLIDRKTRNYPQGLAQAEKLAKYAHLRSTKSDAKNNATGQGFCSVTNGRSLGQSLAFESENASTYGLGAGNPHENVSQ